jgi:hypothetical protein
MHDVIEVSYTGDLLGHRRCPRAWCYEKQAGFHPYEQVQAMEGRLVHHAMEWLTRKYIETGKHASRGDLEVQLTAFFRVLWARGIRTTFESKKDTISRVVGNLFPMGQSSAGGMHPTVKAAIEGAQHTEYELKTVKKLIRADFGGKSRLLLTGILDLVVQQEKPLTYPRSWVWDDMVKLTGVVSPIPVAANTGDVEIWDYKGTKADTKYITDYVRQLLTYAALYKEKSGTLPKRCVLFFINEKNRDDQLLAIKVDESIVDAALKWTIEQVKLIRATTLEFQRSPLSVEGGGLEDRHLAVGQRVTEELKQQCTACGFRFDCPEYTTHLPGGLKHPDVELTNIRKN